MEINSVLLKKEKSYLHMERYVNDGSPSGFDKVHTSSYETAPRSHYKSYNLLIIKFDESIEVKDIGSKDSHFISKGLMFCHPDNINEEIFRNIKDSWEIVDTIEVAPTSSARTVKVIDQDYYIKLDYIGYLGRIKRNLDHQHILSAYEVTKDICNGISKNVYCNYFGVLKENRGRIAYIPLKNGSFYEFGYIIRDAIPHSNNTDNELFLIPGFSLFSTDTHSPYDEPLLIQLFKKSNKEINDFAYNDVFKPIIDCYFDSLCNHGFLMEAHSQNILFAINKNYEIKLIVSRDMESIDKDIPLRDYLGLKNEISSYNYKCIRDTDYNYTIKHSFMFDFKLGEYLLNPLFDVFSSIDGFNYEKTIDKVKLLSRKYIAKLPENYFPETWYSYENIKFEPNKKRPYICHDTPKYR